MAKVKLPLLSMTASGGFGKTISFYTCRSIQTARKGFVSRPNDSEAQRLAQKYFGDAYVAFKFSPYTEEDRKAWKYFDRWLIKHVSDWVNFEQEWLRHTRAGETWVYLYGFSYSSDTPGQALLSLRGPPSPPNVRAYLSKGVGYWATSKEMGFTPPDQWEYLVTGLTPGVRESVSFVYGPEAGLFGSTGKYFFGSRYAQGPPISGP